MEITKSIIKKFRRKIWSKFVSAVKDYNLIEENDKIAVCISGGKDSFLLALCLDELKRHGQFKFDLVFLCMNPGYKKENLDKIKENASKMGIDINIFESNIFEVVDNLEYPYISYRFWTLDKSLDTLNNKYLDMIRLKYKVNELYDKMKLDNKVYLSLDSKFDWPSTSSGYYKKEGTCLGGKSQLAILSNGVVSICCLDSEGESNLGNIFTDSMEDIISSDKFKNTIRGFNDNKVYLDICKHCSYKERFNKKNYY